MSGLIREHLTDSVPDATIGDFLTVMGCLANQATTFVDWELLQNHSANAISPPGKLLLEIIHLLKS